MKKYVAGLAFSNDENYIALIIKKKPDFQKGKLNSIGGKIEEFDSIKTKNLKERSLNAMVREFQEETGVLISNDKWELFLTMGSEIGKVSNKNTQQYNEAWSVDFWRTFTDDIFNCKTTTDEEVKILSITQVLCSNTIDNLKWLILLALDKNPKLSTIKY